MSDERKKVFLSNIMMIVGASVITFVLTTSLPFMKEHKITYNKMLNNIPKASICELTSKKSEDQKADTLTFLFQLFRGNSDSFPWMHKETCHRKAYKKGDTIPPLECTVEEQTIERFVPDKEN